MDTLNTPEMGAINDESTSKNELEFTGEAGNLLVIMITNWILCMITLGLYYPWARVKKLAFIYQNTYLNQTAFVFSGTGNELFKGFIKFFAIVGLMYGILLAGAILENTALIIGATILFFIGGVLLVPLAMHGAFRYRLSRTSWRGINFGYRGDRGILIQEFIKGYVLTLFTFGLYQSWFVNTLRKYIIGNMRFGSLYFGYDGEGSKLFVINLKGIFLSYFTLGIYYFWYKTNYINYFANHVYIEQNGKRHYLKANTQGSEYFGLMIVNMFLTLFTFGLGTPWVIVRTIKYILNNLELPEEIDFNTIAQTEDEYKDATGDDALDYLDLGII